MAVDQGEPVGPDLAQGITESELPEGSCLTGHFEGEPVMLARVRGEVFAVAAHCTHYGGPLAEGLINGEMVHCPWHHACFSLRTGEAVSPPALNDIATWGVRRSDGRIVLTGRVDAARPRRTPVRSPESIGIVGAGAAGNVAAETLRREGYAGPITVFDAESASPYDRPNLSKDYLAGNAPEEWIPLHPPEFYGERNIEFVRQAVLQLDAAQRAVMLADRTQHRFEALILAPGAEAIRLPVPADAGTTMLTLRSLNDSRAIIAAAAAGGSVAVIGASFIGLEVAASLRQRGLDVHIIAPEPVPLARIMGPDLGRFIRELHEEHGVHFHLGRTVSHVGSDQVTLDDGTRIEAGLVVQGVGVRPRTTLAQEAGLTVNNGIVVNQYLETSAPGIWAAGDAAAWPDARSQQPIRVEHWVVAERMGRTAARNVLGLRTPFTAAPFFWSQHYDVTIAYVGHAVDWDEAELAGDPAARDCAVRLRRDGRTLALATIFRDQASLAEELRQEAENAQAASAAI